MPPPFYSRLEQAALQLNTLKIIPKNYPEWFAYELTQALSQNRGIPAAIEFATLQNLTPPLFVNRRTFDGKLQSRCRP